MTTDITTGRGLEPLMNVEVLADYLGVPVTTIYDWRVAGKGPCAIRVGRPLKFAVSDVRDWLAHHRAAHSNRSSRPCGCWNIAAGRSATGAG